MRKAFLLLGFLFTTFLVSAQEKAEIQFKEETINYGKISRGSDGLRVFEFTNTGDAPLVITNVRSSCGCTIPKKPEEPILPGQQGKIEVQYDSTFGYPVSVSIDVEEDAVDDEITHQIISFQ